jgi:hypothetical protein
MKAEVEENKVEVLTNKVRQTLAIMQSNFTDFSKDSQSYLRNYSELKLVKMEGIRSTINSWVINLNETFELNLSGW